MAAAPRCGAERTAPTSQAVRTGGVAAQAPSPLRVAPAPSRRQPAGFAAGATAGRSPTPRQVSGAAARTSPGGARRKHRRFLASPGRSGPGDAGWRRGGDRGGWRPTLQAVLPPRLCRSLARLNSCLQRKVDAVSAPVARDLSFPERSFLEDSFVFSLGPRAAPTDVCSRARILLPSVSWLGTGRIL